MHELLLYGQVPRARHEQVLKVLAGVAAMQPRRVLRRHIVYKPQREPAEPGLHMKRGGTQDVAVKNTKQVAQKDLYFSQLVQQLSEQGIAEDNAGPAARGHSLKGDGAASWSIEFNDVPEAGDRGGVLVRYANSTEILSGNGHDYMVHLGNQFVSEYYVEGHRFVLDNVVIFLHRILQEPGVRSLETSPKNILPSFADLQPLDPSGAYILEAKIRIKDINDTAVADLGVGELNRFKAQMKGCVELDPPERLLLDTRVRYKPRIVAPVQRSMAAVR